VAHVDVRDQRLERGGDCGEYLHARAYRPATAAPERSAPGLPGWTAVARPV
jgi:hypothetical protein